MKTLIAYFSHAGENYFGGEIKEIREGNAKVIAEKTRELTGADIFEIETVKTYSANYKACCDEALIEQRNGELPELKNYLQSIDEYENIVLIYPCWWGTMPQACFTFLDHYDFSDKNIYPICTHEGSGMGRSEIDIQKVQGGANVSTGLAIVGSTANDCDNKLNSWLKSNNLI